MPRTQLFGLRPATMAQPQNSLSVTVLARVKRKGRGRRLHFLVLSTWLLLYLTCPVLPQRRVFGACIEAMRGDRGTEPIWPGWTKPHALSVAPADAPSLLAFGDWEAPLAAGG